MSETKRAASFLALCGLLLVASACSDPWVVVQLEGQWPEAIYARVTYQDGDFEAGTPFDVTLNDGMFSFHIPRDNGTVRLVVTTREKESNCKTKILVEQVSVADTKFGKSISLNSNQLKPLSPPRCNCMDGWCQEEQAVTKNDWYAIWANNADNFFITGTDSNTLAYQKKTDIWTATILQTGGGKTNRGIWGSSSSNIWIATQQGEIYKGTPGMPPFNFDNRTLFATWGIKTTAIAWAVGVQGGDALITSQDRLGGTFTNVFRAAANTTLFGTWGTAGGDAWAVGSNGTIVRRDGGRAAWSLLFQGLARNQNFNSIWGLNSNQLWVAGSSVILHGDGNSVWQEEQIEPRFGQFNLNAIQGSSANNIWAVGEQGVIFHYNGKWQQQQLPGRYNLHGVCVLDEDNIWIVGDSGTVLLRDP